MTKVPQESGTTCRGGVYPALFALAIILQSCASGEISTLSEKITSIEKNAGGIQAHGNSMEARLSRVENIMGAEHDVSTRIVGSWAGILYQVDPAGSFRERAEQSITFNADGSVSQARLPGLGTAVRYEVINPHLILFSLQGGRERVASSVVLEGNRLSFLLDSSPHPVALVLSKQ